MTDMLRPFAILGGLIFLLFALLVRKDLEQVHRLPSTLAAVGSGVMLVALLVQSARTRKPLRLLVTIVQTWIGAIVITGVGVGLMGGDVNAVGTGIGAATVYGFMTSVGGALLLWAAQPLLFPSRATASEAGADTNL